MKILLKVKKKNENIFFISSFICTFAPETKQNNVWTH